MLLGSERLIASSRLNGLRVGVLANPASVELKQRIVQGHALPGTESPDSEVPKELMLRLRGSRQHLKTHVR